MDEVTINVLIKARFSGSIDDVGTYMNLVMQAAAVLVAGIVLWRASAAFHRRKKAERKQNTYFKTPYSKGWKK